MHKEMKIRIITGSPVEVWDKDPKLLKDYAIILPVVAREHTLPYSIQNKLISYTKSEQLLKQINEEALGKIKYKREHFKYKEFEMIK